MTINDLLMFLLKVILIVSPIILFGLWFVYVDTRPPRKIRKKLKGISNKEKISIKELKLRAYEAYIDAYEKQVGIDWGEYI